MQLTILAEPEVETKDSPLFAEITPEESAIVNGGRRRRRRSGGITNRARNQVVFTGGTNFVTIFNL